MHVFDDLLEAFFALVLLSVVSVCTYALFAEVRSGGVGWVECEDE